MRIILSEDKFTQPVIDMCYNAFSTDKFKDALNIADEEDLRDTLEIMKDSPIPTSTKERAIKQRLQTIMSGDSTGNSKYYGDFPKRWIEVTNMFKKPKDRVAIE